MWKIYKKSQWSNFFLLIPCMEWHKHIENNHYEPTANAKKLGLYAINRVSKYGLVDWVPNDSRGDTLLVSPSSNENWQGDKIK